MNIKLLKRKKTEMKAASSYLERMIKTAQVIEDTSDSRQVGLNGTVVLYIEDDDCTEEYKIVTTVRADVLHNLISIESPMGKAL